MQFCKECDNKLFPIEEDNKLWNKCMDCGFKEEYNESVIDKKIYKNKYGKKKHVRTRNKT